MRTDRICPSMEPTIQSGDMIVVERITAHTRNFQRGDIVVCRSPTDPDSLLCKRVVGLPGDILDNPETGSQIVPKGNVWLLGDNYTNSTDSRHFGFVPIGLLIGRAFFKLNKLQTLS
ncbi:mitochondrial inner membrane protease subunit 1-like isoform X2 [Varroa jacobsoni]|uniref:mitochondrial inner membrane protease subunit 1-like isoform X2 n=1 Tax=Varroa jacobsoni TaxID=62625 RepID=UPI000BF2E066|nr:mitochondrial inner membrane protease subunit 1-like isoform X2 [Varroa jacobsoni]